MYFFTSTVFNSSLRLTVQIYPGCENLLFTLEISFLLFFHNLSFQNMLINLVGKESPQHVLLNFWHECDSSNSHETASTEREKLLGV